MKIVKVIGVLLFITAFITASPVMAKKKKGIDKKTAKQQSTEKKTPEFKDILNLKTPSFPVISPDGNYILFNDRAPDWDKNSYVTQIWLAVVKTGEIKQMTFAKKSSTGYSWAPDSKSFTFRSDRGDKNQLYRMSVSGGEGKQISNFKSGYGGYRWSPDGKKIAYTARDEKNKRRDAIKKKYGSFDVIDHNYDPSHLWLMDVKSGKTEKIVDREDLHIGSFDWSPSGDKIAFSANPDTRIKSFSHSDVYVVNIADKKVTHLVKQNGPDSSPVWSPDGKTIAFSSGAGSDSYFTNNEICTVPAKGGPITCLTKKFDEDKDLEEWKKDGIYFTALQGMKEHVFHLDPKTKKITNMTPNEDFIFRGFSMDKKGESLAFVYVNGKQYPELYYSALKPFKPRKLTNYSDQIKDWKETVSEGISWKSKDGAEITGVLTKPADFDPKKKYPLFVIIHGGPTGISYPQKIERYNSIYPIQKWAAKGGLILQPNYRGSAGFGSEFRKLNFRNMGVGDYWDVISGVDHLIAKGFVDKDRVASMGWSQGGYISAFITTFSDRFKAVSVGAGISDWVTYYYRTDITPFTVHYLGKTPWDDPEVYKKTSPMTHINNAKTPTLIQHGEFDRRVPTTNAYKLYRGLQDKGVPSKLIIYKGFGHGVTKPKERLALLKHNWDWFNQYIYGEKPVEETFDDEDDKKDEKKKKKD